MKNEAHNVCPVCDNEFPSALGMFEHFELCRDRYFKLRAEKFEKAKNDKTRRTG